MSDPYGKLLREVLRTNVIEEPEFPCVSLYELYEFFTTFIYRKFISVPGDVEHNFENFKTAIHIWSRCSKYPYKPLTECVHEYFDEVERKTRRAVPLRVRTGFIRYLQNLLLYLTTEGARVLERRIGYRPSWGWLYFPTKFVISGEMETPVGRDRYRRWAYTIIVSFTAPIFYRGDDLGYSEDTLCINWMDVREFAWEVVRDLLDRWDFPVGFDEELEEGLETESLEFLKSSITWGFEAQSRIRTVYAEFQIFEVTYHTAYTERSYNGWWIRQEYRIETAPHMKLCVEVTPERVECNRITRSRAEAIGSAILETELHEWIKDEVREWLRTLKEEYEKYRAKAKEEGIMKYIFEEVRRRLT